MTKKSWSEKKYLCYFNLKSNWQNEVRLTDWSQTYRLKSDLQNEVRLTEWSQTYRLKSDLQTEVRLTECSQTYKLKSDLQTEVRLTDWSHLTSEYACPESKQCNGMLFCIYLLKQIIFLESDTSESLLLKLVLHTIPRHSLPASRLRRGDGPGFLGGRGRAPALARLILRVEEANGVAYPGFRAGGRFEGTFQLRVLRASTRVP